MPAVEVSAVPYAAEERPSVGVLPSGPLPQWPIISDYMGEYRVCGDPPVGGRISLFVGMWQAVTSDAFVLSVVRNGFQISVQNHFPGVLRKATVTPQDPTGGPSYPRRDTRFDFERCNRSNKRCSESLFVSNFRYPQEIRGSSSNFESQGVQSVHFHSALPDGNPECDPSSAVSERLGCFNRLEGCVPSYSDSPVVKEISGFSVLGQDLPIQGPALRSQGFSLGVHKGGGHSCRSSSPVRSSSVLLSGRLASGSGVQGSFGVSSPYDPAVDSGPGVPSELGEVLPHSTETSVLSWGSSRHPKVVGSTFRAQSFGSSGGDSGSYQGSFGARPLVAEISRPPCQLRGPCSQLQAADETSSASSSEVFHSLDRLSGQACSLESRNQGVVRGVGLSFSPSRREAVCCSSPVVGHHHGRVRSGVGGGGRFFTLTMCQGFGRRRRPWIHINTLELKAVLLALQNLESLVVGHSLLIRSDNMTVVSFINHQGGTHSLSLCRLALDLWEWCLRRRIFLHAAHIPGEENIVADFLSRGKYLPTEWVLNRAVFRTIYRVFSPPPEIDLFASALNFRLPKYCSRCPGMLRRGKIDALSFPWTGLRLYAFPPFSLLPRILDKLAQDEADLLLVAPFWPQRPWFPRLLRLSGGPSEDVASLEGLGGTTPCL